MDRNSFKTSKLLTRAESEAFASSSEAITANSKTSFQPEQNQIEYIV